jgi:hypothetical protein
MNTQPTPETESWCGWGIGGLQVVPASFARKLERERDEATKQRNGLQKIVDEKCRFSSVCCEYREQRDRLAEALRLATAYPLTESWYNQAIEALATLKPCD